MGRGVIYDPGGSRPLQDFTTEDTVQFQAYELFISGILIHIFRVCRTGTREKGKVGKGTVYIQMTRTFRSRFGLRDLGVLAASSDTSCPLLAQLFYHCPAVMGEVKRW